MSSHLTRRHLNRATLARQGLLEPLPAAEPIARSVERAGALQAQHPAWPPFALRTRLPLEIDVDLAQARRERTVVRASLMRMTVHVVSAGDFWPISTLTHRYRHDQFRAMYKLDPATSPLGRRLMDAQPVVFEAMRREPLAIHQIESLLAAEVGDMEVPANRAIWRHFSGAVPLVHVPHEGEGYGRSRYLPAADWLRPPTPDEVDEPAAAANVAARYLAAFGPASVDDLGAYIGRGRRMPVVRRGLEALGDRLLRLRDDQGREMVDLVDAPRPAPGVPAPPRLLARWDSLLLAYGTRHRTRVLPEEHRSTVITRNGDVLPTILVDGFVAGTWLPRRDGGGAPYAELRPFGALRRADRAALEEEAQRLVATLPPGAFSRYPGTD
jgi:hypothetical protein